MPYSLKTTGIATQLIYCVAIDDDGTTIREFVDPTVNANMVVHPNVTVATGTWASTARNYWVSGGSGFTAETITFPSGFRPLINFASGSGGSSHFYAFESITAIGSSVDARANIMSALAAVQYLRFDENIKLRYNDDTASVSVYDIGGGVPQSMGSRYHGLNAISYGQGLRGGAYTQEADQSSVVIGGGGQVNSIIGNPGQGAVDGSCYIACAFTGMLTDQDFDDLHNDWFNTLFDGGAPAITVDDTGTLADGGTGAEIRAGGQTVISTVTNDTFDATLGADNQITTDWIQGYTSDGAEANGWNNQVRDALTFAAVTRDSATQVTLLLPAFPAFSISGPETITHTVPANALVTSSAPVIATPLFDITPSAVPATVIMPELRNNTGLLLTGQPNLAANCLNPVDGTLVVRVTGLSSDVSTADVVISDAALTPGQDYVVTLEDSTQQAYAVRTLTAS